MIKDEQRKSAMKLIIILGIVSLMGDITYEGARSISGPFLRSLGASVVVVGIIAGLGEFIGYALRLASGYLADRTEKYWFFAIVGYGLIISIPFMGFAKGWQIASIFVMLERIGKAIRAPSRDAILSHATKQVGRGFGFGIHEAFDQIGAIVGPLIFSAALITRGGYRTGFHILWIPAILVLVFVFLARARFPEPKHLESKERSVDNKLIENSLPKVFILYIIFSFLSVVGYASFPFISYHLTEKNILPDYMIPILYAIAMGVDAIVALLIGKLYDKRGLLTLLAIPIGSIIIPFFVFLGGYYGSIIGIILWGAVMGIHETIMRASIADMISIKRRAFAYGIFNTIYGLAFLIGGAIMGLIYKFSINYLIVFMVLIELVSIAIFIYLRKIAPGRNLCE